MRIGTTSELDDEGGSHGFTLPSGAYIGVEVSKDDDDCWRVKLMPADNVELIGDEPGVYYIHLSE